MKIIFGLGNFPDKYLQNRHNIGFLFVDYLAKKNDFTNWKLDKKFNGKISFGNIFGEKIILFKPHTFMNDSGSSLHLLQKFYKITSKDFLIIADDLALDFEKIRLRQKGSHGGHNGHRSIINHFGSDYARLKFGINNKFRENIPTEKFVLQNFSKTELGELEDIFTKGVVFLGNFLNKKQS